jgi:hypothetical protein
MNIGMAGIAVGKYTHGKFLELFSILSLFFVAFFAGDCQVPPNQFKFCPIMSK